MSTASLTDYYQTNAILVMEFDMSIRELDQMLPFERELYCHIIAQRLEDKRKKSAAV